MRIASLLARLGAVLFLIGASSLALVPPAAQAATVTVVVTGSVSPRDVTVAPGTTVEFRNDDGNRHRPRSVTGPTEFDVDLDPGETGSVTLQGEGTYRYIDDRDRDDENYWGSITVSSSAPHSGATGGTGGAGGTAGAPPPAAASVSMLDRSFSPSSVVVAPGGNVTWTNASDRTHTVTSTSGAFDSGDVNGSGTFRFTFPSEGTFGYRCDLHPEMTGAVTVSAAPGAAPAPPPPPAPSPAAAATAAPTPAPAPPAPAGAAPATRRVRVVDNAFEPAALGAVVGDTVVWTNAGRAPHTVTASSFDSGRMAPGATFSTVLRAAGTFRYGCTIHPEMVGSLTVGAASAPPPAAAPRPPAGAAPTAGAVDEPTADGGPDAVGAGGEAPPATADVEVRDFSFAPRAVTVRPGGTVTWTWTGEAPHTVTGDGFDSEMLETGATFSHTFGEEGTFDYTCTLHPQMRGTVKVAAATAAASTAKPGAGPDAARGITAAAAAAETSPPGVLYGVLGAAAILGGTASLLVGARRFMLAAD
ncbi:MAG TPA: plastocyanin/azurin family copper-binding protein [Acidimicrobiales bacterium]